MRDDAKGGIVENRSTREPALPRGAGTARGIARAGQRENGGASQGEMCIMSLFYGFPPAAASSPRRRKTKKMLHLPCPPSRIEDAGCRRLDDDGKNREYLF